MAGVGLFYVGAVAGWDGAGLGWFALFVALAALGYSWHAFAVEADPAFGVIWVLWAVLWFLFFLLLGLDLGSLAPAVGFVALVEGLLTAAVPAFLILSDQWSTGVVSAVVIAAIGALTLVLAIPVGRLLAAPTPPTPPPAAPAVTTQPKESSHA